MNRYERDTWFNNNGSIIFTNSKGLVGVGLPRNKNNSIISITYKDSRTQTGKFGWEDIRVLQAATTLPAGSVVSHTVIDDTQPGGVKTRTVTYTAPFALASREADYKIAWDFFS